MVDFAKAYILLTITVVISMLMSGCTAHRSAVSEKGSQVDPAGYFADTLSTQSIRQVEDLPPLRLPCPAFFVRPIEIDPKPYNPVQKQPETPVTAISSSAEQLVDGYRIQLYAGREQALARKVKAEVENRFQQSVYLIFETPQYKVRIGDFVKREDAGILLRELHKAGYRDAWIVASLVKIES